VGTKTTKYGSGKRESHDSSAFYERRLQQIALSDERTTTHSTVRNQILVKSSEMMSDLPSNSVALMVTSPPYHVGKEYDSDLSYEEFLDMLKQVFTETYRVLEPGGRAVINVANLGRRPYTPLSHHVTQLMIEIGFLMRGEIIWQKAKGAGGNCAWGSWRSPSNPTFRDLHEYLLCFSKGRFERVNRPGRATIDRDDFMRDTLSIWDIPPESAKRVNHPAPFPVELPRRLIRLYTFENDLVLDPFMGSGSTGVAAAELGRDYVGYEISEEYARIAEARIAQVTRPETSEVAPSVIRPIRSRSRRSTAVAAAEG
jgi:site-specific DNA-methyltransferase (adenine-specific)